MSKEMSLIVLGIMVAVIPQLGVPGGVKTVLLTVVGVAIAILGFLLRGEILSRKKDASESYPVAQLPDRTDQ